MQKAISELHRVMKIVREYLEKKTMNALKNNIYDIEPKGLTARLR